MKSYKIKGMLSNPCSERRGWYLIQQIIPLQTFLMQNSWTFTWLQKNKLHPGFCLQQTETQTWRWQDWLYSSSISSLCITAKQISQPTGLMCVFCFHGDTLLCASRLHSLKLGWSNMFLNSLFLSIHQPLEKNNMALPRCGGSHSSNLPPGVSSGPAVGTERSGSASRCSRGWPSALTPHRSPM